MPPQRIPLPMLELKTVYFLALKGGAKVEIVARILGHAGVGVTCDIYRHVATQELHQEHIRFSPLNNGNLLCGSGNNNVVS